MTTYVVLVRSEFAFDTAGKEGVRTWMEYGRQKAHSAEQAVREAVNGASAEHFAFQEFVAIPERSFRVLAVSAEPVRRVVIGAQEASER